MKNLLAFPLRNARPAIPDVNHQPAFASPANMSIGDPGGEYFNALSIATRLSRA